MFSKIHITKLSDLGLTYENKDILIRRTAQVTISMLVLGFVLYGIDSAVTTVISLF